MRTVITDGSPQRVYEWTVGDRLRVAREQAGYDQREFAKVTGISRATIVNYEHGTYRPRAPMLAAWCLATGFDKQWLLTGEVPNGPERGDELSNRNTQREASGMFTDIPRFLKLVA